jgi:hypothetical protein
LSQIISLKNENLQLRERTADDCRFRAEHSNDDRDIFVTSCEVGQLFAGAEACRC